MRMKKNSLRQIDCTSSIAVTDLIVASLCTTSTWSTERTAVATPVSPWRLSEESPHKLKNSSSTLSVDTSAKRKTMIQQVWSPYSVDFHGPGSLRLDLSCWHMKQNVSFKYYSLGQIHSMQSGVLRLSHIILGLSI